MEDLTNWTERISASAVVLVLSELDGALPSPLLGNIKRRGSPPGMAAFTSRQESEPGSLCSDPRLQSPSFDQALHHSVDPSLLVFRKWSERGEQVGAQSLLVLTESLWIDHHGEVSHRGM